ncbi:MAG: tRNA uridine-5-carboxymethylaminomethyl(34) synthesis enzyme MnmG [Planctomycetes bacterium]|nr:tRNA uridine-5-carboxymethylaminomethyl(34) synthesis enzyme MnmG [Planctomycetota bacterium]
MVLYDVVVVGAGHAGIEAALVSARMGCQTLLLTISFDTIAQMSCNPAIGGLAKGQLVREIDALGGEMAKATDATGIQFRMLNTGKGPAVQSLRAQCDKKQYHLYMKKVLKNQDNLILQEDMVNEIMAKGNCAVGVKGKKESYYGKAVIITTGTFMKGLIHIGEDKTKGGRINEPSAENISDSLVKLGLELGRLKTGTPPRLDTKSIDYPGLIEQPGDEMPKPFSFSTEKIIQKQIPCYITHTNNKTHEIIRKNLDRAPLYTGQIKAIGPRYCPSIEDKIVRFAGREQHQVFLEPEGRKIPEVYCNGISTSLPKDVQEEMVHSIEGLEDAEFIRYGYAIEYDVVLPHQIKPTLETKKVENLFVAGQINGTSGYEEAGAQGLMAGINAVLKIRNDPSFILGRDEAYIGVLIDDLVTLGPTEPYRMFTSRAEYRLLLRSDNADRRLMPYANKLGLLDRALKKRLDNKERLIRDTLNVLSRTFKGTKNLKTLLKQPEITLKELEHKSAPLRKLKLTDDIREQVEIEAKYEGYIQRQLRQIEKARKMEDYPLPPGFDYGKIGHLSKEARTQLNKFKPASLGQASRIAGVSPADITVLMVYFLYGRRAP